MLDTILLDEVARSPRGTESTLLTPKGCFIAEMSHKLFTGPTGSQGGGPGARAKLLWYPSPLSPGTRVACRNLIAQILVAHFDALCFVNRGRFLEKYLVRNLIPTRARGKWRKIR